MIENSPEKGGLEPWFNVFMLSVGFHKRQNASFNLTNHRLVMNADVRCKNAGVRRVFNGDLSAAVIGRTGLRRKMLGALSLAPLKLILPGQTGDVYCFRAILVGYGLRRWAHCLSAGSFSNNRQRA